MLPASHKFAILVSYCHFVTSRMIPFILQQIIYMYMGGLVFRFSLFGLISKIIALCRVYMSVYYRGFGFTEISFVTGQTFICFSCAGNK